MMERTHWRQFVGLPHKTGADPRHEDAADCLLVAFAVLDELHLMRPPVDPLWFELAKNGQWQKLREILNSMTLPSAGGTGAIAMTEAGVVVCVDGGVLLTQHSRGVRWVPMEVLRVEDWRRFQ